MMGATAPRATHRVRVGRSLLGALATLAWAAQMALNLSWTVVFFGLRAPWPAVLVIVLLLVAIVVTIELDRRVSVLAAALMAPYLAWVGFAAALTVGVAVLN